MKSPTCQYSDQRIHRGDCTMDAEQQLRGEWLCRFHLGLRHEQSARRMDAMLEAIFEDNRRVKRQNAWHDPYPVRLP